jgi:hypothetical protein
MKTKSSRRTLAMTSLSNGSLSLLAPTLLRELLSAYKSPPSLVEGGREWPRLRDWVPEVSYNDKGGNEAVSVGMPSFVAGR